MQYKINIIDIYNLIVTIMAFIISAGGAYAVITKFYGLTHKAEKQQSKKIEDHAKMLQEHEKKIMKIEEKLGSDYERISYIEKSSQVTQEALFALISHALDGNSIDELKRSKENLQNFLIKGGTHDDRTR